MYLISACLAGVNCKYNGGNNECRWVKEFMNHKECMLVCPEALGNLPTPRPPCEIVNGKAFDKTGKDITENLLTGSEQSFQKAEKQAEKCGERIEGAILKANSPSCGCGKIYDGTFSSILVDGDGFFTRLLKEKGLRVFTEKEEEEAKKAFQK